MITWRRKWQPTPVFMPRESHGQWSLEGYRPWGCKGFPGDSLVKNPPAMQEPREMWDQSLGWEDPLEKGMATHSSIYFGRVPWAEESGRLQSMGSHRVGHEWGDLVAERGKPVQVQRDKTGALGQEVQENSPAEPGLPSPLISVLLKPPSKCSCSPWRIHPLHPVCRSGTAQGLFLIFPIPFFSWVELRLSQTLRFWVLTWNSTPFVDVMIRYCQHKSVCLTHSRPSTSKTSDPGAEKGLLQGPARNGGSYPKKPWAPPRMSAKHFSKPGEAEIHKVSDQLMHSSLTGWWQGSRVVSKQPQKAWDFELRVIPLPFVWGDFHICKTTQEMCIKCFWYIQKLLSYDTVLDKKMWLQVSSKFCCYYLLKLNSTMLYIWDTSESQLLNK